MFGEQIAVAAELKGGPHPSPQAVIKAAGLCRVVVTGSYHAAVFALSQGIPAIGLSASKYYVSKFSGLQKQFGRGVEHVLLGEADFGDKLRKALQHTWATADSVRPLLLSAAQKQIEDGTDFYRRVADLVHLRRGA